MNTPSPAAGAAPFSVLLQASWMSFKVLWKPLLIGAAVIGVVLALVQLLPPLVAFSPQNMVVAVVALAFSMAILSTLISMVGYAYFLAVATEGVSDATTAFRRALQLFLPLLGVAVWTLIRTFVWIPLLLMIAFMFVRDLWGYIPLLVAVVIVLSIVFGPRFLPAPVLYVQEKAGVRAAVNRSFTLTKGYWGKVIGYTILLGFLLALIMMVLGMITSILGLGTATNASFMLEAGALQPAASSPFQWVASTVLSIISMMGQAFMAIFVVKLTATIVAHPRQ